MRAFPQFLCVCLLVRYFTEICVKSTAKCIHELACMKQRIWQIGNKEYDRGAGPLEDRPW